MSQPTPEQAFQTWMSRSFENCAKYPDRKGYSIIGPQSHGNNCLAHAIGQNDIRITPMTLADLIPQYESYGYYQVDVNGDPQPLDAEVYAKQSEPRVPLHAHRVVGPAQDNRNVMECSSKMGDDFLIRHPRDLLQCKRATSAIWEYGIVQYRFRHDADRYKREQDSVYKTRSGRAVKGFDTILTKSNQRILKADKMLTKSHRITKRPRPAPSKAPAGPNKAPAASNKAPAAPNKAPAAPNKAPAAPNKAPAALNKAPAAPNKAPAAPSKNKK